jgi:tRNA(Ile)-lysidine synthase
VTLSLPQAMAAFSPQLPLAVGYSGGADSTALLLACAQKWPGQVVAWHVHHGLQAAADNFARHCQSVCAAQGIPLRLYKVNARHQRGESPEDAARRARYQAFCTLAQGGEGFEAIHTIALAQHADDQIETMLLALSRGAGAPGLSAMPQNWQRDGLAYHRPLLQVSGAALRQWLAGQGVDFVEDPSNDDERYTRNRIRAQLMPALQHCFSHFRDTFARSARHLAQAQAVLHEVAQQDLLQAGTPPKIKKLQTLSAPSGQCAAPLAAHATSGGAQHGATGGADAADSRLYHPRASAQDESRQRLLCQKGRRGALVQSRGFNA